jgi:hypothetical protein
MFKHTISLVALFLFSTSVQALPISMRTKVSCLPDYYRFCSDWPQEELRRCFQINVLRVHSICINALIDEHLISKSEVDEMKKQALALQTAKPVVKSTMPPPINPNPTVEDIRKNSKPPEKIAKTNKETKKEKTKPSAPKKVPDPNFERWKKQNGFT